MDTKSPTLQPKKVEGTITISNETFNIDKQAIPSAEPSDSGSNIVKNLRKAASKDLFSPLINDSR